MKYANHKNGENFSIEEDLKNIEKYQAEFEKTKKYLPSTFVSFYDKYGLHDCMIENINITKQKTKKQVEFIISIDFTTKKEHIPFRIVHREVSNFNINWNPLTSYCEIGDYVNGEILLSKKNWLTHEFIIFSIENRFYIKFRKMEFYLL